MTRALLLALLLGAAPAAVRAQAVAPRTIEIPPWFSETFLDLREDVRDAAKAGKRLLLYFGQDGCPYCKALMQANFIESNPLPVKAVLAMMGRIGEHYRLPLVPMKKETRAKLEKIAREAGVVA